jgi:glycosyltransferase involved in cell wall biosynthesis
VADVFLHTSHGGGFEIPLVESQLCGTPVIVTDFSAMSELVFAGWKVPGVPFMHATGATQRLPIIGEVVRALHESYQRRDDFSFRQQARVGALRRPPTDANTQRHHRVAQQPPEEPHSPPLPKIQTPSTTW